MHSAAQVTRPNRIALSCRIHHVAGLLLVVIATASCTPYDSIQPRTEIGLSIAGPALDAATHAQHVRVRSLSDGQVIRGSSSTLMRRSNGLNIRVTTRELGAGESVDVFWAIFNNPAGCIHPNALTGALCSPPDLFVAASQGSLHHLATLSADAHGKLSYRESLASHSSAGCVGDPFLCTTLIDLFGAEIHSAMFVPNGGPGRQAAQFLPQ